MSLFARNATLTGMPVAVPQPVPVLDGADDDHDTPISGVRPVRSARVPVRMGWEPDAPLGAHWWAHAPGATAYACQPSAAIALLEHALNRPAADFDVDADSLYHGAVQLVRAGGRVL